jgi:capsular polysaccharide export protein
VSTLELVDGNPALLVLAQCSRVLLLQGPVGPMFDRLTHWLQAGGATVRRVVFQGGDRLDCQAVEPIEFKGTLTQWPVFLEALLEREEIDCIVLFGQSRAYHGQARALAGRRQVRMVVMEEGYFRPGFMTMELDGVNGYSTTMQKYRWRTPLQTLEETDTAAMPPNRTAEPDISSWHFQKMCWHATRHYLALNGAREEFSHYQHHRGDAPMSYARYWMRSWTRKLIHQPLDSCFEKRLFASGRRYFFVPLQHDGDSQITHHSPFKENTDFIIQVMESFCESAPDDAWLVFRQHPQSRGGPGHHLFIRSFAAELGIEGRVHHVTEGSTPLLAQNSAGVVVINSTVGLQALERGAPLKALGDALYNQMGLTYQGSLDRFWQDCRPADRPFVESFLLQMKNLTQVPASAYALREEPLRWGFAVQN